MNRRQTPLLSTETILWLQTTAGNRAVQRLLALKKAEAEGRARGAEVDLNKEEPAKRTSKWHYCWSLFLAFVSWIAVWKRSG